MYIRFLEVINMWEFKNPSYGDQIRVNRGLYSHHGIYASDNEVYHFAAVEGSETNPENAKVICTSLDKFLKGGNVEVRVYSDEELLKKKTPDEIIDYSIAEKRRQNKGCLGDRNTELRL